MYRLGESLDIQATQSFDSGKYPVAQYFYREVLKRIFDILAVVLVAPIVIPVIGVAAFFVSLDGGSAFYSHRRVGRNGQLFSCWKLRSMCVNADEALEKYLSENPAARREWELNQKLQHDPRITRVGRFIRRTSIDELPQLLCVLLGEMSIVGPRPFTPDQEPLYPSIAYYAMRPGLTGLWQISERSESTFAKRAVYDNQYAESVSLQTDFGIIWRTFGVVLRATGV